MKYLQQFVTTSLNVGGGIDASQTTGIVLQSLNNIDETKPSVACLSWADPLNTSVAEWVTYTSINSTTNELQGVTRGAEGYSAKTHENTAVVAFPLSKSHVNELNDLLTSGSGAITATLDEDDMASNSATALATQQSIVAFMGNGWCPAGETWVYASADDPTFTFTVAGVDLTTKYSPGMRIKLTQTTVKYFIITAVAFSTNTTITVYGGTDYDLANEAITLPYFSTQKAPVGFPLDPSKWSVKVTDVTERSQSSPTQNSWYNTGSLSISLPIGVWDTEYMVFISCQANGASANIFSALSTANNSASDDDLVAGSFSIGATAGDYRTFGQVYRRKDLVIASKTSYYMNMRTTNASMTNIAMRNDFSKLVIRAVSAYL